MDAQPRRIIYCAVPRGDEMLHHAVSVEGVHRVLAILKKTSLSARFIYVSTNSVFSGLRGLNREIDIPDPENRNDQYRIYAMTRAEGERVALTYWQNSIVV